MKRALQGMCTCLLMFAAGQSHAQQPTEAGKANQAASLLSQPKEASSLADAIQLIQIGAAQIVVVQDDFASRKLIEQQTKRPSRVRSTVKSIADLGGDGCKRIEMAFVALDLPVEGPKGQKGLWSVVMQWNLCNGGIPPEPR